LGHADYARLLVAEAGDAEKLPANQKWKLLTQYKGSTLEMLVRTFATPWYIF
jgi:hypothetical protein